MGLIYESSVRYGACVSLFNMLRSKVLGVDLLFLSQHELIIPQAPLLLLSTLNGSLIAVKSNSGEEVWRLKEGLVTIFFVIVMMILITYIQNVLNRSYY